MPLAITTRTRTHPISMLDRHQESLFAMIDTAFTDSVVATPALDDTIAFLNNISVEAPGLYLLTGVRGSGKTTALKCCFTAVDEHTLLVKNSMPRINRENLTNQISQALGVYGAESLTPQALVLRYFLKLGTIRAKGKRFIIVLDDVDEIHQSGGELIKSLLQMNGEDGKLVTIVLCGDSALETIMDTSYKWGIAQMIQSAHRVEPLSIRQAQAFLSQYLGKNPTVSLPLNLAATEKIAELGAGIPERMLDITRLSNTIAVNNKAKSINGNMVVGAVTGKYQSTGNKIGRSITKLALGLALVIAIPFNLLQHGQQQIDTSSQPLSQLDFYPPEQTVQTEQIEQTSEFQVTLNFGETKPDIVITEDNIPTKMVQQQASMEQQSTEVKSTHQTVSFNQQIPDYEESLRQTLSGYLAFNQHIPPFPKNPSNNNQSP